MKEAYKQINLFQKLLLIVGIGIILIGFYFTNNLFVADGKLSWDALIAGFLWMALILILILADSAETIKQELKEVITELRDIQKEQLMETKLLRDDLKRKKK
jgi:hypothetical protein